MRNGKDVGDLIIDVIKALIIAIIGFLIIRALLQSV